MATNLVKKRVVRPPFVEFMKYYLNHSVTETAYHFGIAERTIYHWLEYYEREGHTRDELRG